MKGGRSGRSGSLYTELHQLYITVKHRVWKREENRAVCSLLTQSPTDSPWSGVEILWPVTLQSHPAAPVHIVKTSTPLSFHLGTEDAATTGFFGVSLRTEALLGAESLIAGIITTRRSSTAGEAYNQQQACWKRLHPRACLRSTGARRTLLQSICVRKYPVTRAIEWHADTLTPCIYVSVTALTRTVGIGSMLIPTGVTPPH